MYWIYAKTNQTNHMDKENQDGSFKRELGLLDGTMLVVGSMIGSGIFIVSADIARQVGSARLAYSHLGGYRNNYHYCRS
ncbi:hypothetical protein [Pedobacter panaciterrae]